MCLGVCVFAHNQKAKGDRFSPRSRKCVFVGYSPRKKGWKLYDLETRAIFVSHDVLFFEQNFPYAPSSSSVNPALESSSPSFSFPLVVPNEPNSLTSSSA